MVIPACGTRQGQRIIPHHQSGIIGARPIFWEGNHGIKGNTEANHSVFFRGKGSPDEPE
jgi:hypothetical protein